ncbi:MAG: sigma-54-dependent transcriptional regulator [Opitutales bacterium]
MADTTSILVIDDDADLRYSLERVLSSRGYRVQAADSGESGLQVAKERNPQVILLDNRMGGMSGLETLQNLRHSNPAAMIILMTAFGTTQTAIEAMKFGAFDYIIKPFDTKKILGLILKAEAAVSDLSRHTAQAGPELNSEDYREGMVGNSEPMQDVFKTIGQVAASDVTVMITGESGTGKELVARCLYQHSHRAAGPFIAVNCAAIPDNLIESELFGHEKGAFTGATNQRKGKFELCDGGTIFLDEIGDMVLPTQTKILRAIQEGEIQRVGGTETIKVDVRLIAATNKDLEKMVEEGTFREDLYYRLNVVRVRLPALRERLSDVPALVEFVLQRLVKERKARARHISPDAMRALCAYSWPGNVRELENTIYRSAVMAQGDTILRKDLPADMLDHLPEPAVDPNQASITEAEDVDEASDMLSSAPPPAPAPVASPIPPPASTGTAAPEAPVDLDAFPAPSLPTAPGAGALDDRALLDAVYDRARAETNENILGWLERAMIERTLRETGGNQLRSAAILGITRATLRKRIEQYELAMEK